MLCVCGVWPPLRSLPPRWGCVVITVKRSSGHKCVDECVCVCQHLLHLRVPRGKYNTDQDNSYKDEWRRECRRDRPKDGKNISCSCARGIATERIFESTFPLLLSLMNGALLELIKQDQRVKFTFRFFFFFFFSRSKPNFWAPRLSKVSEVVTLNFVHTYTGLWVWRCGKGARKKKEGEKNKQGFFF